MKLVVGLGNPGSKYVGTRHNVGFDVLAEVARAFGQTKPKLAFQGEVVEAVFGAVRALLLCPHTFMNRSGISVFKALEFYKITHDDLLVVCDDFHLPLGKLRFRPKGSSGGQKGLNDIIRQLGTEEFSRLRFGVGEPPAGWDAAAFVLSKFSKQEMPEVGVAIKCAAAAVRDWATLGTASCMNRYN